MTCDSLLQKCIHIFMSKCLSTFALFHAHFYDEMSSKRACFTSFYVEMPFNIRPFSCTFLCRNVFQNVSVLHRFMSKCLSTFTLFHAHFYVEMSFYTHCLLKCLFTHIVY